MPRSATLHRSHTFTHATRRRESVDERFSGYLLELAAKAAEKKLREQASAEQATAAASSVNSFVVDDSEEKLQEQVMAAFPNEEHHEHVDHFIHGDTDEAEVKKDTAKLNRESSFAEHISGLLAIHEGQEKQEELKLQQSKPVEVQVS